MWTIALQIAFTKISTFTFLFKAEIYKQSKGCGN